MPSALPAVGGSDTVGLAMTAIDATDTFFDRDQACCSVSGNSTDDAKFHVGGGEEDARQPSSHQILIDTTAGKISLAEDICKGICSSKNQDSTSKVYVLLDRFSALLELIGLWANRYLNGRI